MPVFSADDGKNILSILAASMRIWRSLTNIGTKLAHKTNITIGLNFTYDC